MKLISSLILLAFFVARSTMAGTVEIEPGVDIQFMVDEYPPSTTFILKAGIHRLQQIDPKEGDTFIGEKDSEGNLASILNGSSILPSSGWQDNSSNVWVYRNVTLEHNMYPDHGSPIGCLNVDESPCNLPENLFRNNVMLKKTANLSQVNQGRWYFDLRNSDPHNAVGDVYIYGDPRADVIELGKKRFAFGTEMTENHDKANANITIKNLVIEKYACLYQMGAIGNQMCGDGWQIIDNEIRLNGGAGINAGHKAYVKGNYVHDNSQVGMKISLLSPHWAEDAVVSQNLITYNGLPAGGFNSWESGGTKFARTKDLHILNNTLHHNHQGGGIWMDMNNIGVVIERNYSYDNDGPGIWYERQEGPAIIRYNTLKNNCLSNPNQANLSIQSSKNATVYNNLVVVGAKGHSIMVSEPRMHLKDGYYSENNEIRDNVIYYREATGKAGFWHDLTSGPLFEDFYTPSISNNSFEGNRYYFNPSTTSEYETTERWLWRNQTMTLAVFQSEAGMETEANVYGTTIADDKMADDFFGFRSIIPSISLLLLD